jgi:biopolymer transport protein ExbB
MVQAATGVCPAAEAFAMMYIMTMGGPVLWVILGFAVVGFAVFIERLLHLHRARIKSEDFLTGIFTILGRGNANEALTMCRETPGPVAHVVGTAILHRNSETEALRAALQEATESEISRMERRLVAVSTVAQVTPLLGLLGTVLGLMEFLLVMQHQLPLVQSADVMGGMMKALITTAAGLTVAIPAYVSFNLLVVKVDRLVLDMNRAASEITAFLVGGEETRDDGHAA